MKASFDQTSEYLKWQWSRLKNLSHGEERRLLEAMQETDDVLIHDPQVGSLTLSAVFMLKR
jgi:hypothetical protein